MDNDKAELQKALECLAKGKPGQFNIYSIGEFYGYAFRVINALQSGI